MSLLKFDTTRMALLGLGYRSLGVYFLGSFGDGDIDYYVEAPEKTFPLFDSINDPRKSSNRPKWRILSGHGGTPEENAAQMEQLKHIRLALIEAGVASQYSWFSILNLAVPGWKTDHGVKGTLYLDLETLDYTVVGVKHVMQELHVGTDGNLTGAGHGILQG